MIATADGQATWRRLWERRVLRQQSTHRTRRLARLQRSWPRTRGRGWTLSGHICKWLTRRALRQGAGCRSRVSRRGSLGSLACRAALTRNPSPPCTRPCSAAPPSVSASETAWMVLRAHQRQASRLALPARRCRSRQRRMWSWRRWHSSARPELRTGPRPTRTTSRRPCEQCHLLAQRSHRHLRESPRRRGRRRRQR